ncbi:MAG: hypothetical protein HRU14_03500 [Planctomycetes bacterium]|nr:hypothetical protein [Planctomycetota bacterium]
MRHLLVFALGALAIALVSDVAPAQETKVKVKVVNGSLVYYPSTLKTGATIPKVKPAVFSTRRALAATTEYKQIKAEKIKEGSAKRRLLEVAASKRLRGAISRVVSLSGYDLVAETGAVTVAGKKLPDITSEVINNLQ